jgi:hypothetical protein
MLERNDQMDEMDQGVAGLRVRRSPPQGAEARVLAGLEGMLGGPPAGGGGAAPISAGWVVKVIAATVAMTAGGLALVRIGAIVISMGGGGSEAAPVEVREDAASVPVNGAIEQEQQPAREPILLPTPSEPAIERERTPDSLATAEPANAPLPSQASDLEAELAMIRDARAQTDPEQALTRLDDHARTFPSGALADEREALRVIALCKLDRLTPARSAARALVESRPSSPLLDRMREGCPALADELGE